MWKESESNKKLKEPSLFTTCFCNNYFSAEVIIAFFYRNKTNVCHMNED